MKKKFILKNIKGNAYIDITIFVIIAMMLIILFMNVSKVYMTKKSLDDFSSELIKTAEIYGEIGEMTDKRIEELKSSLNINPKISWITPRGKIQLNNEIKIHLEITEAVGIGGLLTIPVKLTDDKSGLSEMYFKELAIE